MVTWAADSFTRPDSTGGGGSLGTAETGGAWTAQAGVWGIINNVGYQAAPVNDVYGHATVSAGFGDVTVQANITLSGTLNRVASGLLLRYTDANNFLRLTLFKSASATNAIYLEQTVASSNTGLVQINSAGLVNGATYQTKVVIVGATATVYLDGVLRVPTTAFNAALTTQKYGLAQLKGSVEWDDGGSYWDNFLVMTPGRASRMGRVLSA